MKGIPIFMDTYTQSSILEDGPRTQTIQRGVSPDMETLMANLHFPNDVSYVLRT